MSCSLTPSGHFHDQISIARRCALTSSAHAQTSSEICQLLDAGTYVLLVKLPIRPERHDDFLKIIRARIEASRHRPEIVDFRVMSTPDANVFIAVERFRDKAAIVCGVDKRAGASLVWEVGGEEECTGSKRQALGVFRYSS